MKFNEKDLSEYCISLTQKPSAKDVKDYVELVQKIANLAQHETRLVIEFGDVVIVDLMIDVSETPSPETIPIITEEMIQKVKDLFKQAPVLPTFPVYPGIVPSVPFDPNVVIVYGSTPNVTY
jgi:hypothetical protein